MFGRLRQWIGRRAEHDEDPVPRADTHDEAALIGQAYRRHRPEDVARFTELATDAFPHFAGRIGCFGADWLGRQFATDGKRVVGGEPQVLLLDVGSGEAFQIEESLAGFHERELFEAPDAAIALSLYKEWVGCGGEAPAYDQCVGYRRPLFLGGTDDIGNLELTDFEVYWSICGQLLEQTRHLPPGTRIGSVGIGD